MPENLRTKHPRQERIAQLREDITRQLPAAQRVVQKFPQHTRNPRQTIQIASALARPEISRLEEEEKRRDLEDIDPMTGILTREAFDRRLPEKLTQAHSIRKKVVLLLFDLNGLHRINERLGHAGGDMAIQASAVVLQGSIRSDDITGRRGKKADEFMIAATVRSMSEARRIYARVNDNLKMINEDLKGGMRLTMPAGAAIVDPTDVQGSEAKADRAMYEAKRLSKTTRQNILMAA